VISDGRGSGGDGDSFAAASPSAASLLTRAPTQRAVSCLTVLSVAHLLLLRALLSSTLPEEQGALTAAALTELHRMRVGTEPVVAHCFDSIMHQYRCERGLLCREEVAAPD